MELHTETADKEAENKVATLQPLEFPEIIQAVVKNITSRDDLLNIRSINKKWNDASLQKIRQTNFHMTLDMSNISDYVEFCKSVPKEQLQLALLMPINITILFGASSTPEELMSEGLGKLRELKQGIKFLISTFGPGSVSVLDIHISRCFEEMWVELVDILKICANHLERLKINQLIFCNHTEDQQFCLTGQRHDPFEKAHLSKFTNLRTFACYPKHLKSLCQGIIERSPNLLELIVPEQNIELFQICAHRLNTLHVSKFLDDDGLLQELESRWGNMKELSITNFGLPDLSSTILLDTFARSLETLLFQINTDFIVVKLIQFPVLPQLKRLGVKSNNTIGFQDSFNFPILLINSKDSFGLCPERFPNLEVVELDVGTIFIKKIPMPDCQSLEIEKNVQFSTVKSLILTNPRCPWDEEADEIEEVFGNFNYDVEDSLKESMSLKGNLNHFNSMFPKITHLAVKLNCPRSAESLHQLLFELNFPHLEELEFINYSYKKSFLIAFLREERLKKESFSSDTISKPIEHQDGSGRSKITLNENSSISSSDLFSGLKFLKLRYYTAHEVLTRQVGTMYYIEDGTLDTVSEDEEEELELLESITLITQYFGGLRQLQIPLDWLGKKNLGSKQAKTLLMKLQSQFPQLEISLARPDSTLPSDDYYAVDLLEFE